MINDLSMPSGTVPSDTCVVQQVFAYVHRVVFAAAAYLVAFPVASVPCCEGSAFSRSEVHASLAPVPVELKLESVETLT